MIRVKIAFKNLLRHKFSSLVLVVVFLLATLALFWVFGWGNAMAQVVIDYIYGFSGDISYATNYFRQEEMGDVVAQPGIKTVSFEATVTCMLESPKKSEVITLKEMTPDNLRRLSSFIQPVAGRFPEEVDEILIPAIYQAGRFELGDRFYISTVTPGRVMNTLQYRVVGINKSPYAYVTSESMDLLLNSEEYRNFLHLTVEDKAKTRDEIDKLKMSIDNILEGKELQINSSTTVFQEMDRLGYLVELLPALKILMMIILFPLVGAVVAAIVWVHTHKRRKEIWTYLCLGWKDRKVISIITYELVFDALSGIALGLFLGYLSKIVVEKSNIWLEFGYTFAFPLRANLGLSDIFLIILFIFISLLVWLRPPIRKVIASKPFSY